MLAKTHRLTAPIGKGAVSVRVRGPFGLRIKANSSTVSRFGFVISKKVAQKAVDRNRMKRILRSVIEKKLSRIRPGYDMLFVIRQPFGTTKDVDHAVVESLMHHNLWQEQ